MVLTVAVFLMAVVSVGPWGDPSESTGATLYSGTGVPDDPWVFGNDSELRAYLGSEQTLMIYQADDWTGGLSDIPDYTATDGGPWNPNGSDDYAIYKIVIMDGIKTIGRQAFCNLLMLTTLDLSMSDVVYVDYDAFSGSPVATVLTSDLRMEYGSSAFQFLFHDPDGNILCPIPEEYRGSTFYNNNSYAQPTTGPSVKYSTFYDVGGGSADPPTQDPVREGKKITLAEYSGTKDGSAFKGWRCSSDGKTYAAGMKVPMVSGGLTCLY